MSILQHLRQYRLPILTGLACAVVLGVGRSISSKYAQLLAIALLFLTVWFTLDRRPREGLSPYALQNPNYEKMGGQLTSEDFDAALRGGGVAPIRHGASSARRIVEDEGSSAGSSGSTAFHGTGYRLSGEADAEPVDADSRLAPACDAAARAAAAARARAAAAAAARASSAGAPAHIPAQVPATSSSPSSDLSHTVGTASIAAERDEAPPSSNAR